MPADSATVDECLDMLARRLLARRAGPDHWAGHLASSALSTGTSVLALHLASTSGRGSQDRLASLIEGGVRWLVEHQNPDGGWGDTVRSRSNISTTAIVWAALAVVEGRGIPLHATVERASAWLRAAAGDTTPQALRAAILRRYGKDRTFSVPILTVLALAGKLGSEPVAAWRQVPQLPFELAALPQAWFQHLSLPVVSYAMPALIAIGQVRHRFAPSRNPLARTIRDAVAERTRTTLRAMQPESGGYLEASPLTSFVVMSLAAAGQGAHAVVTAGVAFLVESARADGSWPIDSDLSTWVTSLSGAALARAGRLPAPDMAAIRRWLVSQQSHVEHPFTRAAPGAWAWTPLSGGVPDADDTAGALIALHELGENDPVAAVAATRWLLGLQNRDGGIPTFCRGWGALPFDRSTPELTAHALRGWSAWYSRLDPSLQGEVQRAAARALDHLERVQRTDGSWIPLWFGNEGAPDEANPVYGTARVLLGLCSSLVANDRRAHGCAGRAVHWLLRAQNDDGGWGGASGVASSVEETGVALSALSAFGSNGDDDRVAAAVARGARWLIDAHHADEPLPAPIGLYFAQLWYFEALYPLIFAVEGLSGVRAMTRDRLIHCDPAG